MALCVIQAQVAHRSLLGPSRLRADGVSGASAPRPVAGKTCCKTNMVRAYLVDKENEMKRTIIIVLALLFSLSPAAAQDEGVFEGSPTDFLPLQVGNQWTYEHHYFNRFYQGRVEDRNPEIRMLFEIPGYPYDNPGIPPDSLRWGERELTIEITHTEMIDGLEYFVFSHADYDWPPLPKLFWAGQQVRLSDEGVLLFRWNGQDVPLYDLNFQHPGRYSIPAYPLREDLVTKLNVRRGNRVGREIQIYFTVTYPELNLPNNMKNWSATDIAILPGYGLACNERYYRRIRGAGLLPDIFSGVSLSFTMTSVLFRRLFQEKRCRTNKLSEATLTPMFNRALGVN